MEQRSSVAGSAEVVLSAARAARDAVAVAEVELFEATVDWVGMHAADSIAVTLCLPGADQAIAVAGEGAPLVAEFAVIEYAAALGMSTDAGRAYVGDVVEIRYRLPRLCALVTDGRLPVWRARRVAQATAPLSEAGAGFVDRHVAAVAGKIGVAALDRVVEEARVRFDPDEAEERRLAAADGRCFDIEVREAETGANAFDGTVAVHGMLDLADALDLENAVGRVARDLAALGSPESLAARRAMALGELARRQTCLDLAGGETAGTSAATAVATKVAARQVVLHVHVSEAAVRGIDPAELSPLDSSGVGMHLARVEETRGFVDADQVREWAGTPATQVIVQPVVDRAGELDVGAFEHPWRTTRAGIDAVPRVSADEVTAEQIRAWCDNPDARVSIRPTIDLREDVATDGYRPSASVSERVRLLRPHCVFPHCGRPSRRLDPEATSADQDHIEPYVDPDDGGPPGQTSSTGLAPLCRRHHRVKTHGGWTYRVTDPSTDAFHAPGGYLWRSPHGYRFLVDPMGTLELR